MGMGQVVGGARFGRPRQSDDRMAVLARQVVQVRRNSLGHKLDARSASAQRVRKCKATHEVPGTDLVGRVDAYRDPQLRSSQIATM